MQSVSAHSLYIDIQSWMRKGGDLTHPHDKIPISTVTSKNTKQQHNNCKHFPYITVSDWLRTVWETTATQLVCVAGFQFQLSRSSQQKLCNQQGRHLNICRQCSWYRTNQNIQWKFELPRSEMDKILRDYLPLFALKCDN